MPLRPALLAIAGLPLACTSPCAIAADSIPLLERVQVRATQLQGVPAFDTPASLDVVDLRNERNRADAQASEALSGIAGLSARDRQMCAKFRGNNYFALAREYGLTEMRVRQIVDAWQREQFLRRQGRLPGLGDGADDDTPVIS